MTAILDSDEFFRIRGLLEAGGWRADDAVIARALPHYIDTLTPVDIVEALENLGIPVHAHSCKAKQIKASDCPAIFIDTDGVMTGVLDVTPDKALIHPSGTAFPSWGNLPQGHGMLLRIGNLEQGESAEEQPRTLRSHFITYAPVLGGVFSVSFLTNLLAFVPPLFVMVLYDRVIPTGSSAFLWSLLAGIALVVVTDILLRMIRARALAEVGSSVDRFMGRLLFRKLMMMPLEQLLKSDVNQQLTRLKQFESLRDAFTGPALISFFDLPFTFLFGAVIFAISPLLGLVVFITSCIFGVAYLIFAPIQKRRGAKAAASRLAFQSLQTEIVTQQRGLRRLGEIETWKRRAGVLAHTAAEDARSAKEIGLIAQAFGQSLMILAGAFTIFIGAKGAMDGTITLGALVATMALVWRVLSPLQAIYAAGSQISGHFQSYAQIERMAALPEELRSGARQSRLNRFKGTVDLVAVSFRYSPSSDPIIAGLSVSAAPGQLVSICGPNGAGKSTLLKLIAGLHMPLAGAVHVDAMDIRQIPVDDLRTAISYAPQTSEFFHGTIAQNFRLNNITATDDDIWEAIQATGLEPQIKALADGIHTRLTEEFRATMSQSVLRALCVARAFAKDAAIYVLDEPSNGLDHAHDIAVMDRLRELAKTRTVIIATRFESHLLQSDRVLYIDAGRAIVNAPGPEAVAQIKSLPTSTIL